VATLTVVGEREVGVAAEVVVGPAVVPTATIKDLLEDSLG
jgi:hypothetical protein